MENEVGYCKCEEVTSVYKKTTDLGQWDVCCVCEKPIEGSIESFARFERG